MTTVTVQLMGGTANQMFQYAAGLALSRRQRADLVLDTSWFARSTNTDRPFQLHHFAVPEHVTTSTSPGKRLPNWLARTSAAQAVVTAAARRGIAFNRYAERYHHFDPAFFEIEPPCRIRGYFQSPLYFAGVEDDVRRQFSTLPPLSEAAAGWAARIVASPCAVAVHVRGGDYLTQGAGSPLAPLDATYYRRALRLIHAVAGPDTEIFVFTDDPMLANRVLAGTAGFVRVLTPSERPWEDLHLMSMCRHNVIANSSFSWWGAWLNSNPEKVVIAPRHWFTEAALRQKNICDMFPTDWLLA